MEQSLRYHLRGASTALLVAWMIAAVVLHPASAQAAVRKIPPTVSLVYEGEVVHRARPYKYCWSYPSSNAQMVSMCSDGVPRYPEAVPLEVGSEVTLRIGYRHRPLDWSLVAYRAAVEMDGQSQTVGSAEAVPFRLKPRRVDGIVRAWDVVFRVDEPLRHYYIKAAGELRQGDAFYVLHVAT